MSNKTPIEETFRNAFDNFEADVNDRVWANIEQQLSSPLSPSTGNIAGEAAKTIITGSKFSALTYGLASSVFIAIVGVSYFFLSPADTPIANTVKTTSSKETVEKPILTQAKNLTADTKHENTLSLPKADKKKTKQADTYNTSTKQESGNHQNVARDYDNNAIHNQQVTPQASNEQRDVNNVGSNQVPIESPKENKAPYTADEKHESTAFVEETNRGQESKMEKPSQKDDFEWGVIANSFSPNNDGLNDVFAIKTPDLKSLLVVIYDRNGNIVYKWNNLEGSWNGENLKGKEMPAGLYLYYIFAELPEGKFHSKSGTISIFR